MAENIIIRNACEADLDGIEKLEKECFTVPWSRESLEYDMKENRFATYLVAECDGETAGYMGFWVIAGECNINNVAVSPSYRRKHVGSMIIDTMIKSCEKMGITRFTLEVRKSNDPAIGLYTKYGFKPEGIRKAYYEDNGEDAVIMWR